MNEIFFILILDYLHLIRFLSEVIECLGYNTPKSQTSALMLTATFIPARQTTDNMSPFLDNNIKFHRRLSWVRQKYDYFLNLHRFCQIIFTCAAYLYLTIGIWWLVLWWLQRLL